RALCGGGRGFGGGFGIHLGHLPLRRIARTVSSNRMYIVPPRTVGLMRSPPGVATAAKIAIPRITLRRDDRSRADVRIPTRDSAARTVGNSISTRNASTHVA